MNADFPYYTVFEAAVKSEESIGTIRNRIRAGLIKTIETPVGMLITVEELNSYLNRRGPKSKRGYFRRDEITPIESEDVSK